VSISDVIDWINYKATSVEQNKRTDTTGRLLLHFKAIAHQQLKPRPDDVFP
jgi:hypothetical protein